MDSKLGKIALLIFIISTPLSVLLLVLSIGFAGSPWTNIFMPPSEPDAIAYFVAIWIIIVTPWIIAVAWVVRK